MHPDMIFDLGKFQIQELHKEAARRRLAKDPSHIPAVPRDSGMWGRFSFGKLRSKTA